MTKARGDRVVRSLVVQLGRAVVVEDMMAVVVPTMAEGSSVWLYTGTVVVLVLLTVVGLEGGALMLMLLRVLVVYDRIKIVNQDL